MVLRPVAPVAPVPQQSVYSTVASVVVVSSSRDMDGFLFLASLSMDIFSGNSPTQNYTLRSSMPF